MKPARAEQLQSLIALIDERLEADVDPKAVLTELVDQHGARLRFSCGADELRIAGIAGTSTTSGLLVLTSWRRAALRRLTKEAR